MRCLIADDDFAARTLLQTYMSPVANCVVAKDGIDTVEAFRKGLEDDKPYDLICLDIMLPELDGHAVLQALRQIEAEHEMTGLGCAKVIMTTALRDLTDVTNAFREGCEVYLVKPIERQKLIKELEGLDLIPVRMR